MSGLITVQGDLRQGVVPADVDQPLAELLAEWAPHYSSRRSEELVAVNVATSGIVDPARTLSELQLGINPVLRLVTVEEAMGITGAVTVATPAPPTLPGPPPNVAQAVGENNPAGVEDRPSLRVVARPSGTPPEDNSRVPAETPAPVPAAQPAPTLPAQPPGPPAQPGPPPVATQGPPPRSWASLVPPASQRPPMPTSAPAQTQDIPAPVRGRWRRAVGAAVSRRPIATTQQFAIADRVGPVRRVQASLHDSDRQATLDRLITNAALPGGRCVVIAVVSPKGGVGKSTTAALLGTLLSELRRDPVIAIDANPDFGNLASKLSTNTEFYIDQVASWLHQTANVTPALLRSWLGSGPHGLRFLATPTTPPERMIAAASYQLYDYLLHRLRDFGGVIIVDCGTGFLDPPAQAALQTADQVVLVTDSSATTAQLVVTAARQLPPSTPIQLVANRMPAKGGRVDLESVRRAVPNVGGLTVIPEVRLTENVVVPAFDWAQAPPGFQLPVREVAARLASGWPALAAR